MLTSLITTFFSPAFAAVVRRATLAAEWLQTNGSLPYVIDNQLYQIAIGVPAFFWEAVTVALYAWLICWIWTRSPNVLR